MNMGWQRRLFGLVGGIAASRDRPSGGVMKRLSTLSALKSRTVLRCTRMHWWRATVLRVAHVVLC